MTENPTELPSWTKLMEATRMALSDCDETWKANLDQLGKVMQQDLSGPPQLEIWAETMCHHLEALGLLKGQEIKNRMAVIKQRIVQEL